MSHLIMSDALSYSQAVPRWQGGDGSVIVPEEVGILGVILEFCLPQYVFLITTQGKPLTMAK